MPTRRSDAGRRLGHAVVDRGGWPPRGRCRVGEEVSVLDRVCVVLRVHAGRIEARERDRSDPVDYARTPARSSIAGSSRTGVAVVLLLTNTFVWHKGAGLRDGDNVPIAEHSIAVLPFVDMSRREGPGILLRRHVRGTAQPAGAGSGAAGDRAHVGFSFKGKDSTSPTIAQAAQRRARPRRQRAQVRQPVRITAQLITRAPTRTCGRKPTTAARRHLRGAGRDRRGRRRRSSRSSCLEKHPKARETRSQGLRALLAGASAGRAKGLGEGTFEVVDCGEPASGGDRSWLAAAWAGSDERTYLSEQARACKPIEESYRSGPRGDPEGARDVEPRRFADLWPSRLSLVGVGAIRPGLSGCAYLRAGAGVGTA